MATNKKKFSDINKKELENFVCEFAFSLYQNSFLDKEWKIPKIKLRYEFLQFCNEKGILYDRNQDKKIGSILQEGNILFKSVSDSFCLKFPKIYEYERTVLEKYDSEQINKTEKRTLLQQITDQKSEDYEVESNSTPEILEFQSCVKTKKNHQFVLTNFACYICQQNLSPNDLQEHIPIHNDMTDFEWLKNNPSNLNSNFELFYQTCRNQYYLKFTLKTEKKTSIKILRIITIKSNCITTLKRQDEENHILNSGLWSFIVDRHVFNVETEQPIVIIYEMENLNEIFIEHYFMRSKNLASLDTCTLPGYLSKAVPKRPELPKKLQLKDHNPNPKLKNLCSKTNSENELMMYNDSINKYVNNGKKLSCSNITDVLKFLIELEDIATQNVYLKIAQYQATIKGLGRDFSVKLNNIPKKIVIEDVLTAGDEIILKLQNNSQEIAATKKKNKKEKKSIFQGLITRVYGKNVCFEMRKGKSNKISVYKKYNIEFRPNRLNFKYQYSAIEILDANSQLKSFLFPSAFITDTPAKLSMNIINRSVDRNPEQKKAVMNITDGLTNMPYLIVGPPGTGKTTTIVESILQVKLCHPQSRIVVTAGSNAACDEVGKRLIKLIESRNEVNHIKALRIYAKSVEKRLENLDEILIASSNLVYGDHFYPALETIAYYDVIICTLSVLGRLKSSGMPQNFFSYCFIDECAASTEAEVLIAITAVYHSQINIVIAGDPKQLGPVLQSDLAAEFGLKCSLMERLLSLDCYRVTPNKSYNQRIQTRLVRNFRTHSDILQISNSLFYSNDLIACAPEEKTHWATNWYRLPEIGVPMIFDCVNGHTKKDRFSTSLYNMREVNVVMDYVKRLLYFKKIDGREIKEEDIGIISPYKKQNVIIREELDKRHWYNIATGSVEIFQGQEKPIIIISTVRSLFSEKSGPGFLDNPKRLNVMLTRAQALLIIVGNKELLENVDNWKEAITYFKMKNILTGGCGSYLKSKYILPETCLNTNLQNLSVTNSTEESKGRKNCGRTILPQNLSQKIKKNWEIGICGENKVQNWIDENKNFQKNIPKLGASFILDRDDSDVDTISIPDPLSSDFLNTMIYQNNAIDIDFSNTKFNQSPSINEKIETTKKVEILKEQINSYIDKSVNKNNFPLLWDHYSDRKIPQDQICFTNNGSEIKRNNISERTSPAKSEVLTTQVTCKNSKKQTSKCNIC